MPGERRPTNFSRRNDVIIMKYVTLWNSSGGRGPPRTAVRNVANRRGAPTIRFALTYGNDFVWKDRGNIIRTITRLHHMRNVSLIRNASELSSFCYARASFVNR